jgi:hypothetical protein
MAELNQIGDYKTYNLRMSKPIMDKLFFVDKIDEDVAVIVDYGCADGTLMEHLAYWFPNADIIGYDNDREMVKKANTRLEKIRKDRDARPFGEPGRFFWCDWDWQSIETYIARFRNEGKPIKIAIILSSIIHEVYSYSEAGDIDIFWKRVFGKNSIDENYPGFDYIIIRDMMPSRGIDRLSDVNDVSKVYRKFLHRKELRDFENRWGSIESNKNLVHFLLKYQYTEPNWAREVKENYIPLSREDFLAMLPLDYAIGYHEHYVLPWLKRSIRTEFGIELKDNTHVKMILERQFT